MKAIIAAAGKGSRISKEIGDIPKSTLPLENGEPILRRTVQMLIDKNIQPVLCVGYQKEKIMEALEGLNVIYHYNPFYAVTNNVGSLWFALDEFADDDLLLMSADLYFPADFLDLLMSAEDSISIIVDKSRLHDGDFYLEIKDNIIASYGPTLPLEKRSCEYMGLIRISREAVCEVKNRLIQYNEQEKYSKYFEDVILSFSKEDKKPINFIDVGGTFWREFDFYSDYQIILDHRKKENSV